MRSKCRILLFLVLLQMSSSLIPTVKSAPPTEGLDGVGVNTTCQAVGCVAQLLTTSKGHDVIIIAADCTVLGCCLWNNQLLRPVCSTVPSIKDSSGLVFNRRASTNASLVEYYATADGPLRSDNITLVFPNIFGIYAAPYQYCPLADRGGVFCPVQVLAVHFASGQVFDPNPSVPATVSWSECVGACVRYCVSECSLSIQTSRQDLVIAIVSMPDAFACGGPTPPYPHNVPGFTTLTGGPRGAVFEIDYVVTGPQSTVVFTCSGTLVDSIIIDAIPLKG